MMEGYFYYPNVMEEDGLRGIDGKEYAFVLRTILRKKKNKTWYEIYIKKEITSSCEEGEIPLKDKYKLLSEFHRMVYETLILHDIHPESKKFYPKSKRQDSEFDRLANNNMYYSVKQNQ